MICVALHSVHNGIIMILLSHPPRFIVVSDSSGLTITHSISKLFALCCVTVNHVYFVSLKKNFVFLLTDGKSAAQVLPYIGGIFEHFAYSISFSALLPSMKLCAVKVKVQGI